MPIGEPKNLTECRSFFREPRQPKQRQYEALRRYFVEQRPSREVAAEFGYTQGSFRVLCHHFRREPELFITAPRGPQGQPKKPAARARIEPLRKRNHSVHEIAEALEARGTPLSATAARFFHMDARSSAVGLKVGFDMALLVIASGLYRRLAQHMRGYADS